MLSAQGKKLSVTRLRHQGQDGNGIGVAAAPSIADLTGNGTLEIVLTTFDHGIDVYTVPGSGTGCLPWPTGRGNLLRNGMGAATVIPDGDPRPSVLRDLGHEVDDQPHLVEAVDHPEGRRPPAPDRCRRVDDETDSGDTAESVGR